MPFGIQPIHLLVIGVVALIIFGPSRLPELGRGLGRAITEFRKGAQEMTEGFREEVTQSINAPETKAPETNQTIAPPDRLANAQGAQTTVCPACGGSNGVAAHFCMHSFSWFAAWPFSCRPC